MRLSIYLCIDFELSMYLFLSTRLYLFSISIIFCLLDYIFHYKYISCLLVWVFKSFSMNAVSVVQFLQLNYQAIAQIKHTFLKGSIMLNWHIVRNNIIKLHSSDLFVLNSLKTMTVGSSLSCYSPICAKRRDGSTPFTRVFVQNWIEITQLGF